MLALALLFWRQKNEPEQSSTSLRTSDAGQLGLPESHARDAGGDPDAGGSWELNLGQGGWETLAFDNRLVALAGEIDVHNRYLSAVMVSVKFDDTQRSICGGVIVGRHLVLTAGHCVCKRRAAAADAKNIVIDTTDCARSAVIDTVIYKPKEGITNAAASVRDVYEGMVRPHPNLEIQLNEQGQVVSSRADLAVIVLKRPLAKEFRPASLSETDVASGETITVVGYGYDEIADAYGGDRRFIRNKVARALEPEGDRVWVEQAHQNRYRGDSGRALFPRRREHPCACWHFQQEPWRGLYVHKPSPVSRLAECRTPGFGWSFLHPTRRGSIMPYHQSSLAIALIAATSLSAATGCGGRAVNHERPLIGPEVSVVSQSHIDSKNHYLSTVRVIATIPRQGDTIEKRCSGVLVNPTAGPDGSPLRLR